MQHGPVVVVFAGGAAPLDGADHIRYRAAGTGRGAKLAAAEVEATLREDRVGHVPAVATLLQTALYRRDTSTDFITMKERHSCTVHLFGLISDKSSHGHVRHLEAVADLLAYNDVPFVIHAILDGVDMEPKSAQFLLEALADRLQGKGSIATVSGRSLAFDEEGDWERTLEVYRAIVHADGDRYESIFDGLSLSYDAGYTDATMRPFILGDYLGVRGELLMEVPSDTPGWKWRSTDLAIFAGSRGEGLRQLVAVLTRQGLPEDVAAQVTIHNRPVIAFDTDNATAFVRVTTAPDVRVAFSEPELPWSLGSFFAARGATQLRVSTPGRQDHVEHYFDGAETPQGVEIVHVATDAEAVARAGREVTEGSAAFVVVGLSGRKTDETDLDAALAALGDAVKQRGGLFLVNDTRTRCVASGDGREVRDDGTETDIAPTILDFLDVDAPDLLVGRTLFVRPRGQ